MNIHKRFVVQLFLQLMLIFFLIGALLFFLFGIIGYFLSDSEAENDLSLAEDYFISQNITVEDGKAGISDRLKKLVGEQHGRLLVVSADGKLLGGYPELERTLPL